ncbi:hypothetical protein, partial [Heyndrickxia coagulans]|uniref:hypothetical protein n=1 Tax=Heyndrickxia coagulans TaxID=1398 RepID=UPI00285290BB
GKSSSDPNPLPFHLLRLLVGSIHFDPSLLNSSKYLSYFNCIKAIREKMLKIGVFLQAVP